MEKESDDNVHACIMIMKSVIGFVIGRARKGGQKFEPSRTGDGQDSRIIDVVGR